MLFKNIEQFKASFGGVQRTMNWETWVPFVAEAEELFISPAIGDELLVELSDLVESGEGLDLKVAATAKQKILIAKLRMAVAAYADYQGWFRMVMTTGDAGKTTPSPTNMQAPAKWATVGGLRAAIDRGDKALENSLQYLEKNAADFATWAGSEFYTVYKKSFVSSATELTLHFPHAKNSRRMYMSLKPRIDLAEKGRLEKVIGKEFIAAMAAKRVAGDGSDIENEAIALITRYVALRAVVDSIPYLNISEDWRLISESDGVSDEDILPRTRREEILLKESENLELAQNELVRFLQENAAVDALTVFFESDYYVAPADGSTTSFFKNDKTKPYAVI
jgi:hypothetical protein